MKGDIQLDQAIQPSDLPQGDLGLGKAGWRGSEGFHMERAVGG